MSTMQSDVRTVLFSTVTRQMGLAFGHRSDHRVGSHDRNSDDRRRSRRLTLSPLRPGMLKTSRHGSEMTPTQLEPHLPVSESGQIPAGVKSCVSLNDPTAQL